jgi:outer membrane protein OmpA-like peptidoglycan-associated protein
LWPATISAQSILEKRADLLYENFSYSKAASIYESLYKRYPENGKLIQRLAYCYDKMLNYKKALLYYSYLVQIDERKLEDYYQYAQLLRINGNIEGSKIWLEKYIHLAIDDARAISQYNQLTELIALKDKIKKVNVTEVLGNSRFTDMSPAFYNDQLVFSSAMDSFSMVRNEFKWNDQPFLNLYMTKPNPKTDFKESSALSKKLNTRLHEGPVSFSADFNTIYFTRNSYTKGNTNKSHNGINNLKIFVSRFDGKDWSEGVSFPHNSNSYSVGHPALSPDNKTLYFVSDMPGGFGQTDIYKSELVNGQWSKPVNLGETINTSGKEMFPFVDKEDILYFSSDGRPGMAGLDIYAAKSGIDGQYIVANFDAPINSKYDDFGLILNTDSLSGYFTSNRPGGTGEDDIYHFSVAAIDLQVTSILESTMEIMPDSKVFLKDEKGDVITSAISDKNGQVEFSVKPGLKYSLLSENNTFASDLIPVSIARKLFGLEQKEDVILKQGYPYLTIEVIDPEQGLIIPLAIVDISEGKYNESELEEENGLIRMKMNNETDYTFDVTAEGFFPNTVKYTSVGLVPGEYSLTVEMEKLSTGKQFTLDDLFYDLNKSNIRPDAALVLDDLAQILLENQEVRIEIGSHTDSRATAEYNLNLSQRRSESVVAYLIGKGVAKDRLVAKGFGESQLINHCADGIDCPEEEHQANRRTVIEILNKDIRKVKRGARDVYYF